MLKVAGGGLEEFILRYPFSLYTYTYYYCFSATYIGFIYPFISSASIY